MNPTILRPNLEIADQPTGEELARLRSEGYSAVVNLRRPGEPDQPIDPTAEGDLVREEGLEYLSIPIGGEPITEAQVSAVCDLIDRHSAGKVLLHCKQGGRAAGLALLYLARAEGWPNAEVIDRGRSLGLRLPPPVEALVKSHLKS
jgi:uncharacterized protein (TIGR01244 family)